VGEGFLWLSPPATMFSPKFGQINIPIFFLFPYAWSCSDERGKSRHPIALFLEAGGEVFIRLAQMPSERVHYHEERDGSQSSNSPILLEYVPISPRGAWSDCTILRGV